MRFWCQDETRVGLHLPVGRRISACGIKPIRVTAPVYQDYWRYAAVQPACGATFWLELPALDTPCFPVFLERFGAHDPQSFHILVLDNAPAHIARAVAPPANVVLVNLPPYCPELNPVERLWQRLKRYLTDRVTTRFTLDTLRQTVDHFIQTITTQQLASLTNLPYLQKIMKYNYG